MRGLHFFFKTPPRFLGAIALGDLIAKYLVPPGESCGAALHANFEFVVRSPQFLLETFPLRDVAYVQKQSRLSEILDLAGPDRYRDRSPVGGVTKSFKIRLWSRA